jgi:hypothetical protein
MPPKVTPLDVTAGCWLGVPNADGMPVLTGDNDSFAMYARGKRLSNMVDSIRGRARLGSTEGACRKWIYPTIFVFLVIMLASTVPKVNISQLTSAKLLVKVVAVFRAGQGLERLQMGRLKRWARRRGATRRDAEAGGEKGRRFV